MDRASTAFYVSRPPVWSSYWTGRGNQVVANDKRIYYNRAHEPLVPIRDEVGPELRGSARAAIRRLIF